MSELIVITGGSGGIGSATAARLIARGRSVALIARDRARLDEAAARLGGVPAFAADALDPAAFGEAIARVERECGEVAGLVHAVGSIVLRPLHALSLEDWRATYEINVTSAFVAMKAVLPPMMRRKRGSIVLFSSVAAATGLPNHEAIASAKAALEGLVRSSAIGYARYGVRVNAVAPALTKTELSRNLWASETVAAASAALHPLGRIGEPDDVAAAAAYLVSDDAGWVTGQILGVDGGLGAGAAPRTAKPGA
jgi:NAD(P)-dependent dehydrogenase (short-subunit alcohol dehydrogenase family)